MSQQFDWRDLVATAADCESRAKQHRPTELSEPQREILKLHRQGIQPRDLAMRFDMSDADVRLLIFGPDDAGTEADSHRVFPNYKKGRHL